MRSAARLPTTAVMTSAAVVGATLALGGMSGQPSEPAFEIAHVQESTPLYASPNGAVVAHLGTRTEFGSPQTLGVLRHRGRWLAVVSTAQPNGQAAWIRARSVRVTRTRMSLTLVRRQRLLVLRRGEKVLRRMTVGVGRASSPTPTGRFAVTDRLSGYGYGPYYGCCIVALSAHQPNLPAGWTGGDRVAIHGTNAPSTIGTASSAGCPHAREADLRLLMRLVPLGTPVFIRA